MTGRGRFFQRAELDPKWPVCFLIIIVGMVLAIFEGSLAQWSALYGSTPMLSLIFLYWVALHHEKYVLLVTGFLIGLTSDILFSDLIGGRATVYFSVVATAVAAFQLVIFSALNLAIPSLTPVLFQVGLTMILFPIGYVILSTMSNAVQKLRTL